MALYLTVNMSAAFDNSEHQNENYCVVLASRPGVNNPPEDENFSCVICPMPAVENLGEEQVVVKTLYLSIDPALRCRMNEETGVEYITAWEVNKCISGLGGVGVVIHSRSQGLTTGDVVIKSDMFWPWQRFSTMDASALSKVEQKIAHTRPSLVLSLLGVSGITSFIGIRNRGHISPGKNQTVVITSAAGACGHLAGQFAKLDGATNVVGICGTQEKCKFVLDECKFDHAINYKQENITQSLEKCCPHGVDVYFDNVGGDISNAVLRKMNRNSYVILCGQIAKYNEDVPYPPPLPNEIEQLVADHNITRERFLVLNYPEQFEGAVNQLALWYFSGKIKVRETIIEGLENAGKAFVSMMNGGNIGKQLVKAL